jgi:hypothetical protein
MGRRSSRDVRPTATPGSTAENKTQNASVGVPSGHRLIRHDVRRPPLQASSAVLCCDPPWDIPGKAAHPKQVAALDSLCASASLREALCYLTTNPLPHELTQVANNISLTSATRPDMFIRSVQPIHSGGSERGTRCHSYPVRAQAVRQLFDILKPVPRR